MSTIYKTLEESLEYKTTESSPIRSFLKNCLSNEFKAESFCNNANLQSVAGVVCFILTTQGNTKEVNDKTKKFICDYFNKQGKESPNKRMLNRRIQLSRFIIKNHQILKEYTTEPTRLIEESLEIVNSYKSYNNLLKVVTESNKQGSDSDPTPVSEAEKLLKRINKLFEDIASLESSKESTHLMQYIRDKADALANPVDAESVAC